MSTEEATVTCSESKTDSKGKIGSKSKTGSKSKIELTEEELNVVSGGIIDDVKTGGNPTKLGRA